MALRLTVMAKEDLTLIRVDGRLAGAGVAELEHTCATAPRPLVLDLTDLLSADEAGLVALRRLAGEGAHLLGGSPYVTLLLSGAPTAPAKTASAQRHQPRSAPRGRP